MTHIKAAGAAQTQADWSTVLRITEVAEAPNSFYPAKTAKVAVTLRLVLSKLQTTWRWIEGKRRLQLSSRRMRIAETISLGEKRTVSIIVVDGAQYLIGSSAGGVQLLTRLGAAAGKNSCDEVAS